MHESFVYAIGKVSVAFERHIITSLSMWSFRVVPRHQIFPSDCKTLTILLCLTWQTRACTVLNSSILRVCTSAVAVVALVYIRFFQRATKLYGVSAFRSQACGEKLLSCCCNTGSNWSCATKKRTYSLDGDANE